MHCSQPLNQNSFNPETFQGRVNTFIRAGFANDKVNTFILEAANEGWYITNEQELYCRECYKCHAKVNIQVSVGNATISELIGITVPESDNNPLSGQHYQGCQHEKKEMTSFNNEDFYDLTQYRNRILTFTVYTGSDGSLLENAFENFNMCAKEGFFLDSEAKTITCRSCWGFASFYNQKDNIITIVEKLFNKHTSEGCTMTFRNNTIYSNLANNEPSLTSNSLEQPATRGATSSMLEPLSEPESRGAGIDVANQERQHEVQTLGAQLSQITIGEPQYAHNTTVNRVHFDEHGAVVQDDENFNEEVNRLATFQGNCPKLLMDKKIDMAKSGLFYTGGGDAVECYSCKSVLTQWEPDDIPSHEHAKFCAICVHVINELGNNKVYELAKIFNMDFISEWSRLFSFRKMPQGVRQSASSFAKAGFYYLGVGDTVQCFYCAVKIDNWSEFPTANPKEAHKTFSPNCPFVYKHLQ